MKTLSYLFFIVVFISCSSTKITDSWRNPEYLHYQPNKVLLLGVTNNLTARIIYEEKLKEVFTDRGMQAVESYQVFTPTFTSLEQTEEGIQKEIDTLSKQGFDAILIATVKGVEKKVAYNSSYYGYPTYSRRFGHYYYLNQEIYYNNRFYDNYKVYHIEISLFNLINNTEKSLVWVASYDIVDPQKINATIKDCVNALETSLEEEGFIPTYQ